MPSPQLLDTTLFLLELFKVRKHLLFIERLIDIFQLRCDFLVIFPGNHLETVPEHMEDAASDCCLGYTATIACANLSRPRQAII